MLPKLSMRLMPLLAAALIALGAAPAAAQCPDWRLNGLELVYSNNDLRRPVAHPVLAGGNIDLGRCGSAPGYGFIAVRPDFTIQFYGNPGRRALEFRVQSNCDSVLLVNGTGGEWYFDDDSAGNLDARIRINRASEGIYDVWVGSLGATCQARLIVETFNSR